MIRVLVVDDSPSVRDMLVGIIESDRAMEVVATAGDGEQAISLASRFHPDVITMDIGMPLMDGIEALRRIMADDPIPTVIVSPRNDLEEAEDTFLAREAGAVAVCQKPSDQSHPLFRAQSRRIVQMVRMASEIPVFRRWKRPGYPSAPDEAARCAAGDPRAAWGRPRIELVAIGSSTGGPPVLCEILSGLSPCFPVPILIVQHIAAGFLSGMVAWLSSTSGFPVEVARDGTTALPGHAYTAPYGFHMAVTRSFTILLRAGLPVNGMCPSISVLFRAVAEEFGRSSAAILLTGMGKDGADELLAIRNRDGLTIAQDKESSAIHGMPGEAIRLGAAKHVLSPAGIVEMLNDRTRAKGLGRGCGQADA